MKSIDFKSLLIGILGTALVMVLMGQSSLQKRYDVECVTLPDQMGFIQCRRFDLYRDEWSVHPSAILDWDSFFKYDIWR